MKILCAGLTACCVLSFAAKSNSLQPPGPDPVLGPVVAKMIFPAGSGSLSITAREQVFQRVGLLPNQLVDIVVQYPLAAVGHSITPEALDGGALIGADSPLLVGADGTIHFAFQASGDPGVARISLHDSVVPQETGLEFWILDLNNPDQNPPVANPAS